MDARLTLLLCLAVLQATVRLTDAAAPPVFTKPSAAETKNVDENTPVGTVVYIVEATDADGDIIAYSFPGTGSEHGSLFDIDGQSGNVTVKTVLDFETLQTKSYDLKFVATANSDDVDSVVVTVNITDVNEPPVFPTPSATVDVLEGATTDIHTLPEATDPEGDEITYSGSEVEGITYSVSASRIITASEAITYAKNNNAIEFKAKDGSNLEDTFTLTLNVKTAPAFTVPANKDVEREIPENSVGGTSVYTVTANDADQDTVTYSFHDTDSEHGQLFVINSTNGEVTVKTDAVLDYEATNNFTLKFVATDKAGHSGTSESILVKLTNVDEAPVFPTPSATVEVLEGATADIHTLPEATDPEGENVTYSVDEQNGITYTIDPTTRSISADPAISLSNDGNEVIFKAIDQTSKTSTYTLTLNVKTGNEENGSVMLGVSTGLLLLMATCASILA